MSLKRRRCSSPPSPLSPPSPSVKRIKLTRPPPSPPLLPLPALSFTPSALRTPPALPCFTSYDSSFGVKVCAAYRANLQKQRRTRRFLDDVRQGMRKSKYGRHIADHFPPGATPPEARERYRRCEEQATLEALQDTTDDEVDDDTEVEEEKEEGGKEHPNAATNGPFQDKENIVRLEHASSGPSTKQTSATSTPSSAVELTRQTTYSPEPASDQGPQAPYTAKDMQSDQENQTPELVYVQKMGGIGLAASSGAALVLPETATASSCTIAALPD